MKLRICCIFPILTVYFVQVYATLPLSICFDALHFKSGRAFPYCTRWRHAGETTFLFDSPGGNSSFLMWSTSFWGSRHYNWLVKSHNKSIWSNNFTDKILQTNQCIYGVLLKIHKLELFSQESLADLAGASLACAPRVRFSCVLT